MFIHIKHNIISLSAKWF